MLSNKTLFKTSKKITQKSQSSQDKKQRSVNLQTFKKNVKVSNFSRVMPKISHNTDRLKKQLIQPTRYLSQQLSKSKFFQEVQQRQKQAKYIRNITAEGHSFKLNKSAFTLDILSAMYTKQLDEAQKSLQKTAQYRNIDHENIQKKAQADLLYLQQKIHQYKLKNQKMSINSKLGKRLMGKNNEVSYLRKKKNMKKQGHAEENNYLYPSYMRNHQISVDIQPRISPWEK